MSIEAGASLMLLVTALLGDPPRAAEVPLEPISAATDASPAEASAADAPPGESSAPAPAPVGEEASAGTGPAPRVDRERLRPPRDQRERRQTIDEYGDVGARAFVFSALAGIGWSVISPVPSADLTVFFGSTLRPRITWRGRSFRGAIGYEPTLSVGGADYYAAYLSFGGGYGLVYHRHHVAVLGYGGRAARFHYAIGGGPLLWATTLTALEIEGRVGAIVHARHGRVRGLFGVRARLVAILGGYPIPQLGIFAGAAVW